MRPTCSEDGYKRRWPGRLGWRSPSMYTRATSLPALALQDPRAHIRRGKRVEQSCTRGAARRHRPRCLRLFSRTGLGGKPMPAGCTFRAFDAAAGLQHARFSSSIRRSSLTPFPFRRRHQARSSEAARIKAIKSAQGRRWTASGIALDEVCGPNRGSRFGEAFRQATFKFKDLLAEPVSPIQWGATRAYLEHTDLPHENRAKAR